MSRLSAPYRYGRGRPWRGRDGFPLRPARQNARGLQQPGPKPLECADEIKRLFVAHDRPEFRTYFGRVYGAGGGEGATSWVGGDERGRVWAYVAQSPRLFLLGRRIVHGSLLANLMVATAYRSFWPGLALVRRVVKDLKQCSSVDFVYTDPNEPARAILERAGFRTVGPLRRLILPLTDRRRSVDLGIRLYHLIGRLRTRGTPLVLTEQRASEKHVVLDQAPPQDSRSLLPLPGASLYRCRLAGYPSASDCWYSFHAAGPPRVPVGQALVRGPDERGRAVVSVLQCEPTTLLSSLLGALAQRLRRAGVARLEVWVMAGSHVASEARRVGFVPRQDQIPIVGRPFTALGTEALAAGSEWRLLPVHLDR